MTYNTILYMVEGTIAIITINRPKVLNALNPQVVSELKDVLIQFVNNDEVKVIILTGAGNKAFIAGADISVMSQMNSLQARTFSKQLQALTLQMENLPKPIIAAVNGFALGGGMELALSCDFIYASENAKFGQPEINLGIIPGAGGTQRLSRLIGKNWAKEFCLTGDIINVELAKKLGIVSRIFLVDQLMIETIKIAKKIASKGRFSIQVCKELINFGFNLPLEHALRLESEAFGMCFSSPDQKEGMNAFIEKRKPIFN